MIAARPKTRSVVIVAVAAALTFAFLVALGLWQLDRLAWKEALVARITERMTADVVPAPAEAAWPTLDLGSWTYRRIRVDGVFDHAREARVYVALSEAKGKYRGPGYYILTPMRLADGSVVIVNRGFVPEQRLDPATRAEGQVAGQTSVTGLLREPEARNTFTPADDAAKRLFFARDPASIGAGLGLDRVAPFTVDADATPLPGGLPQGGETRIAFPNRHFEYALTWFGLAAALLGVTAVFLVGALRRGRAQA